MIKRIEVEAQPSQALAKGLLILEAFSMERPEWGIRELSRKLEINPTTVQRLVTTLQNAGYLERNPETQRYALGPMVMKLANLYAHRNPLPILARKVFESYTDRFDYNFYLGTLNKDKVIYLTALDGRGPIKVVVELGGTVELHTTALGKVLLAFRDDEYIHAFLARHELRAYTPRSITDPRRLWAQLQEVRRTGIAINDGEHFEDVAAVGAPVYDQFGRVEVGVSLAFPRHLLQDKRIRVEDLIPLVREIAREITIRSGGVFP